MIRDKQDEKREWYSNGLLAELPFESATPGFRKSYAMITRAEVLSRPGDKILPYIGLTRECGWEYGLDLGDFDDLRELFVRTGSEKLSDLVGKIVETWNRGANCEAISVNPHLIYMKGGTK